MPLPDPYTHDFIYQLGDGGKYIVGEVEFNKDKRVSYRIKQWCEPIDHEILVHFTEFIERLKLRFDQWEGIKFVQVKEKGYTSPYV